MAGTNWRDAYPPGSLRRCCRCEGEFELSEFSSKKDFRCKSCDNVRSKARQAERIALVAEIKLARGCADCGYREHPAALDFDHLPGHKKKFGIAAGCHKYSWEDVLIEIAKCDVVCANCHRVRTYERKRHGGE